MRDVARDVAHGLGGAHGLRALATAAATVTTIATAACFVGWDATRRARIRQQATRRARLLARMQVSVGGRHEEREERRRVYDLEHWVTGWGVARG